jgi:hypothetical protein
VRERFSAAIPDARQALSAQARFFGIEGEEEEEAEEEGEGRKQKKYNSTGSNTAS